MTRLKTHLSCFGLVLLCSGPVQKESDQQITVQVEGRLTTFTQTGLAASQEYTVTISGEINGQRGAESSAEFTTRECSSPKDIPLIKHKSAKSLSTNSDIVSQDNTQTWKRVTLTLLTKEKDTDFLPAVLDKTAVGNKETL